MRYRLMASYQGTAYQAGVGPSSREVTLFAVIPPPEEHDFVSAFGHWRKQVRISEIDALWESRPVGSYHGEPCLVLDDLGDRLHIAYLGMDELRAGELGYWQVDRGVFEVVVPRVEVADLAEERHEFDMPTLIAALPSAQPAGAGGAGALPSYGIPGAPGAPSASPVPAGAAAWHGSPEPDDSAPWYTRPAGNGDQPPSWASPGNIGEYSLRPDRAQNGATNGARGADELLTAPVAGAPAVSQRQGGVVRGRRAARKPRVATQTVFADLLDLANIPRSSYAVDEEVSGAMCLIKTGGGYEVFSCANEARHEVRFFEDEEGAYFYLFGVLAAEALRNGLLAPREVSSQSATFRNTYES